jgi:coenzyme F420-0:L-glutamate ligase / coenzyme F420-1:gamma-L-glutamate ligase
MHWSDGVLECWSVGGSEYPLLHHSNTPILQFHVSLTKQELAFLRSARIAHFATADESGQPLVVPICFVFDGNYFYSPIDEKPKRIAPQKLKRLKNIQENAQVALVIDRYDEDWRKLAYVLVIGKARVLLGGAKHRKAVNLLRRKYSQYRTMKIDRLPMILIRTTRTISWGAI